MSRMRNTLGALGRLLRRTLLSIITVAIALSIGLYLVLNLIFNGPSTTARDMLTLSLTEVSSTSWIPGIFLEDALIEQIRSGAASEISADITDPSMITVASDGSEWVNDPSGIRIEHREGSTYTAHVLLVRNPSQVYLSANASSAEEALLSSNALAAINAGASGSGYAGFNADDVLMVAQYMTEDYAASLGIQDGCSGGPALIINGQVNLSVYNADSGLNRRTAIGQRADGSLIFLCTDGKIGATWQDLTDILVEYGAVNACAMDSGTFSVMLYRKTASDKAEMINSNTMFQSEEGSGTSFWMVRPAGEE